MFVKDLDADLVKTEECIISFSRLAAMFNVNKGSTKNQESKYRFVVLLDGKQPLFQRLNLLQFLTILTMISSPTVLLLMK